MPLQLIPVYIKKEIGPSDDLSDLLLNSASIEDGDIIIVAQKIVSKYENQSIRLSSVSPSLLAEGIASQYQKDPRIIELILSESKRIIRMGRGVLIVETHHGFICANAGVDESNVQKGYATLLPSDPDLSAQSLRSAVREKSRKNIAVIISDTFGRPFRAGQTDCAIGISGMDPIFDYRGTADSFRRILRVSEAAVSDELCSAAELVMKKSAMCPFVIIRGHLFENKDSGISRIMRPEAEDLFR